MPHLHEQLAIETASISVHATFKREVIYQYCSGMHFAVFLQRANPLLSSVSIYQRSELTLAVLPYWPLPTPGGRLTHQA